METILEKWKLLPEWSRWILCWPVLIIISIVAGFLIQMVLLSGTWRYGFDEISESFYAPYSLFDFFQKGLTIGAFWSVFFISVYYLIPRAQDIVSAFFCFILLVLNGLGIVGHFIAFNNSDVTFLQFLGGSILMLAGLGVSGFWTYKIRESIRKNIDLLKNVS